LTVDIEDGFYGEDVVEDGDHDCDDGGGDDDGGGGVQDQQLKL